MAVTADTAPEHAEMIAAVPKAVISAQLQERLDREARTRGSDLRREARFLELPPARVGAAGERLPVDVTVHDALF